MRQRHTVCPGRPAQMVWWGKFEGGGGGGGGGGALLVWRGGRGRVIETGD